MASRTRGASRKPAGCGLPGARVKETRRPPLVNGKLDVLLSRGTQPVSSGEEESARRDAARGSAMETEVGVDHGPAPRLRLVPNPLVSATVDRDAGPRGDSEESDAAHSLGEQSSSCGPERRDEGQILQSLTGSPSSVDTAGIADSLEDPSSRGVGRCGVSVRSGCGTNSRVRPSSNDAGWGSVSVGGDEVDADGIAHPLATPSGEGTGWGSVSARDDGEDAEGIDHPLEGPSGGGTGWGSVSEGVDGGVSTRSGVRKNREGPVRVGSRDGSGSPEPHRLRSPGGVPPLKVRRLPDGSLEALICEFPGSIWRCTLCGRDYQKYGSLTQHLRRSHSVSSFLSRCRHCRLCFSNRRAFNNHVEGKCRGRDEGSSAGAGVTVPGETAAQQSTLPLSGRCDESARTASVRTCRYCGESWPSQMSLSQHIRNRHMAESQRDRAQELAAQGTARQEVANEACTISEVGTQGEASTGFSSVSPTSHNVSDSPPLTGDAEREPSRSPDKNASASLDESATGDAGTGFSSVALSPGPIGTGVPDPNDCSTGSNCQIEAGRREQTGDAVLSPTGHNQVPSSEAGQGGQTGDAVSTQTEHTGDAGLTVAEAGREERTGDAALSQTGQTGEAVPTHSDEHQPDSRKRKKRKKRGKRKPKGGGGGRNSSTDGGAGASTGGQRGTGASQTNQAGGHRQGTKGQQPKRNGPGRRPEGDSNGRSAAPAPESHNPSQNGRPSGQPNRPSCRKGKPSRGQRAEGDSNARRPGQGAEGDSNAQRPAARAAGAQAAKGRGPGPNGRRTPGDSNVQRPGRQRAEGDAEARRRQGSQRAEGDAGARRQPGHSDSSDRATLSAAEAPRPRPQSHWLTLAYEEVTEEDKKELSDFVRESLDGLSENFEWCKFEEVVQALIEKVTSKCESCMAAQAESRSVNPNQGWRWRQRQRRENSSQENSGSQSGTEPPAGPRRAPENSGQPGGNHGGGNHGARARRRQRARRRYDGPEVQRLQRLFRRNRKSCVREILNGSDDRRCNIPGDEIEEYFRNEYSAVGVDSDNPPAWLKDCLKEPNPAPEWNSVPISAEEVKAQLQRLPSASAPGPDRLPYKVWKAIDGDGSLLARIFEICRRERKIPSSWKKSTTILLYKKGDEKVPSNWRPISLQSAIYKIYAAIWAKRLASWAREAGAISPSQKGFIPGEGCLEHSFLVRSMMEDARRKRRPLHLVWFDLRNAFGSVPHELLWFSLRSVGVPDEVASILMDVYEGSSFKVRTAGGLTEEIPQERGVKQGCPISPLVFNLAIEGLIRGIESSSSRGYSFSDGLEVKSLAYADDLAIASSSEEDIKVMLARLEEFTSWAHLRFNVAKCASLSTTYQGGKRVVLQSSFQLQGQDIPAMEWEDRYRHLGVLLGPNPEACLDKLAGEFRENTEKLFQSGLADWMKLEAFKEFVVPKLDYALRSTLAHKKWGKELDKFVRRTVKRSLGLPGRACDAFFYVPTAQGGLGLRSFVDELGNMMITHATKMLTSPDPLVRGVAQHSLDCTIRKRYGETEGPEDRWRFLAGQLRCANEGRRGDISSIWSRLRDFVGDIGVRLHGGTDEEPTPTSVTIGDRDLSGNFRKVLLRELRDARGKFWLQKWASLDEQGSFAPSLSQASESNYWLRDCRYLRYREYRWAIKARLNLLPVASHKRKFRGAAADTRCRGCTGNIETQEHCLSVCQGNMPAMRARHNKIVERLVGAIPDSLGTKFLDQTVPECSGSLRPDIVILNEEQKKAYLIDVTCPCERSDNLIAARRRKLDKYAETKERLEGKGYQAHLDAFVVGSLGTWDPENDRLLPIVGIGRKYGTLFKKLCCRDAISGSYEVWAARCRRHFQRSSSS